MKRSKALERSSQKLLREYEAPQDAIRAAISERTRLRIEDLFLWPNLSQEQDMWTPQRISINKFGN